MILHIPHSSTKLLDGIKITNIQQNLDIMTDLYVDELFFNSIGNTIGLDIIKFEYSRFICDVERYPKNEIMEDMYGQGVLYKKDYFGNPIISTPEIDQKRMKLYEKHHFDLSEITNKYISYFSKVYIIDCHSFDTLSLFTYKPSILPDICIGTTENNSDPKDINTIRDIFASNGLSVFINTPFSGSMIPEHFIGNENVKSIMIEVNKNLYLKYNKKSKHFIKIQKIINEVLNYI